MTVIYVYILAILLIAVFVLVLEKCKVRNIRRKGVKTVGVIIYNRDSNDDFMYRLGGNINNPVIKFKTEEGDEIIGKPVIGFISQHEVAVMDKITVIYDRTNPSKFCVVEA